MKPFGAQLRARALQRGLRTKTLRGARTAYGVYMLFRAKTFYAVRSYNQQLLELAWADGGRFGKEDGRTG